MNILIFNEDSMTLKMLRRLIVEDHKGVTIYTAKSEPEVVNLITEHQIDMAFIDMKSEEASSGVDIGKRILEVHPEVEFIVIGAHVEMALDAFEIHPYDFFLKPINVISFKRTIGKLIRLIQNRRTENQSGASLANKRLLVKVKKEIYWIPYSKIHFIEKLQKDIYIHTADEAIAIRQNISDIEKKLPDNFLRVHKSYIVNVNHISRIVEHGDRSYEVFFFESERTAYMSRYKGTVLLDRL